MKIKIRVGDLKLSQAEKDNLYKLIESERLSEGPMVKEFERKWAEFNNVKECVAVNSGTSALIAGLYSLLYDDRYPKVKKGAKVITSPVTYIATSNAIVLAGLEPVYVDIDPKTFKLDVKQVEELLKGANRDEYCMILPVHLMGYMNDMKELVDICKKYDLVLFEDAAQAHGSLYNGQKAGSFGLLADFSFYIAHNIQVGEMGALITNDSKLASLFRQVKANGRMCACRVCTRSQGICPYNTSEIEPRFTHEFIGFNFKTTEFQAAIGIPQIDKVNEIIKKRQYNVSFLNKKLEKYSDVLQLPLFSKDVSYLAYPIIIKDPQIKRSDIMKKLEGAGIETRTLFGSIPTHQPAFSYLKSEYKGKLHNAEYVGENGFYIGCHQYLSEEDLEYVAQKMNDIFSA